MLERKWCVGEVIAGGLWLVGFAAVLVDSLVDRMAVAGDLGRLGIMAAMGGSVLYMRLAVLELRSRERDIFEMGRDYGENLRAVR